MDNLSEKTAVITGAASGIGLALSQLLARQGMNVVMADIETAALESARKQVETSTDAEVLSVATDVSRAEDLWRLASQVKMRFGSTHILCNNAGVLGGGQLWESSLAEYKWLMDVNVWGVIHGLHSFLPDMMAGREDCHIVNTASMAALTAMPFAGIYHMTKHAVLGLTESLYKEMQAVAPHVGVSVLCPELIHTGIFNAERNRPATLSHPSDITTGETIDMLRTATADVDVKGKQPAVIAARVLQAIHERQFYILPPEPDEWRRIANIRLDEIRSGTNPEMIVPEE